MKGYLYHEDNRVVVNPEKKPRSLSQVNSYDTIEDFLKHQREIAEWENNHIDVENAEAWEKENRITVYYLEKYRTKDQDHCDICTNAQPCECEITNGKATVIKLL